MKISFFLKEEIHLSIRSDIFHFKLPGRCKCVMTIYLYSKEKSYSCEKDATTSVMLKLDTVKEVTWATKYQ